MFPWVRPHKGMVLVSHLLRHFLTGIHGEGLNASQAFLVPTVFGMLGLNQECRKQDLCPSRTCQFPHRLPPLRQEKIEMQPQCKRRLRLEEVPQKTVPRIQTN